MSLITILDYSTNDLRSVQKAFEHLGHQTLVTSDPEVVARAEKLVLPGVGAFGEAMRNLRAKNLIEPICEAVSGDSNILGVCLGMQLLFDWSEELGVHQGLGILEGKITKFPVQADLKVPHMGWSGLRFPHESILFAGLPQGEMCYFVHSYHAVCDSEIVAASAHHGGVFVAGVERGNVMGAQFHPEKSSAAGLQILDNFARL